MKNLTFRTILSDHNPIDYGLACKLPSRTKQADRDMFNPNNVMKLFRRTGDLAVFKKRQGYYADICHLDSFSSYADVQASMDPILDAFYSLDALEREKFGHDPMNFLDFAKNPANLEWLIKNGFIDKYDSVKNESVVPPNNEGTSSQTENT